MPSPPPRTWGSSGTCGSGVGTLRESRRAAAPPECPASGRLPPVPGTSCGLSWSIRFVCDKYIFLNSSALAGWPSLLCFKHLPRGGERKEGFFPSLSPFPSLIWLVDADKLAVQLWIWIKDGRNLGLGIYFSLALTLSLIIFFNITHSQHPPEMLTRFII